MITTLEDFNTHTLAMKLGEEVWTMVKLIYENQFKQLEEDMEIIGKMINTYIKSIGNKS